MPSGRFVPVLVGVVLLGSLVACGSDGVRDVTGSTLPAGPPPVERATESFRPRYVASQCMAGVPVDRRIRCGWLVARSDRAEDAGPTVRLPVAIVRGSSPTPSPDPVFYLAGGPGASGLAGVGGFLDSGYAGDRDVVAFDQRGTGAALPDLNCPEVERAFMSTFATAGPPRVEQRVILGGFDTCRKRLVAAGVTLGDYRTTVSAADVDDLRTSLGYEKVNLYGASYGTALALTVLRLYPVGVRAVTLDAVYPTTIANGPVEVATHARRAIRALETGCAKAPACRAAAPDLAGVIHRVVARFDAKPYRGSIVNPVTGVSVPVLLTGADIMAGLVNAMYQSSAIAALPAAITALDRGDTAGIAGVAGQGLKALTDLSEGMAASVECADRARTRAAGGLERVVASDPVMATVALIGDLTAVCPQWDVTPADAAFNSPVRSDSPVLLMSGSFDPVTPPTNAKQAAVGLTSAYDLSFPDVGHGAVFSSDCAKRIFQDFLNHPERRPKVGCTGSPRSPWGP